MRDRRKTVLFCGSILILLGIGMHVEHWIFRAGAYDARATVVSDEEGLDNLYALAEAQTPVKFTDFKGNRIYAATHSAAKHSPGKKLDISYQPGDPPKVRIEHFGDRGLMPLLLIIGGVMSIVLGFMLIPPNIESLGNGKVRLSIGISNAPIKFQSIIDDIQRSRKGTGTFTRTISRQTIRVTDPATGEEREYDSLDQVPLDKRGEIEAALQAGMTTQAPETYLFKTPDGSDAVYHSLDEMPPEIRKIFESLHRR